ncbi:MAG: hypothetical protein WCJ31_06870 [Planctomycetia bacterium]
MPRRRHTYDSSLELLLDTICNTFGGILFLAILVSMLLRTTKDRDEAELQAAGPSPAMSRAELIRVEAGLRDASGRVEQLKKSIELSGVLSESLATPEIRSGLKMMDASAVKVLELQGKEGDLLSRLATAQAMTAEALSAVAQQSRDLDDAKKAFDGAKRAYAEEEGQTQSLRDRAALLLEQETRSTEVVASGKAPRERSTTKEEWPLLLRYGRVYEIYRKSGGERSINTADFDIQAGFVSDSAHARLGAGLDASGPDLAEELSLLLSERPASQWYIAIAVFPDSFDAFQRVKTQLVRRGYEYRIIPTDSPVSQSSVPDAKVQ